MNLSATNIREIADEVIEELGYFLIDFSVRGYNKNKVIEIYIDGENDISADDCSKVSREINNRLQSLIRPEDNYRLDVSSPGTERPLKFIQQFYKHINRKFELSYRQESETKKVTARLIEVDDEMLKFFLNNNEEITINFKDILKAKVIISFT
jgi:ribosome maturation factor RimP